MTTTTGRGGMEGEATESLPSVAGAVDVLRSVRKVLAGFEDGTFVRDTRGDGDSEWAVRVFPYLAALGRLQAWADRNAPAPEALPTPSDTPGAPA